MEDKSLENSGCIASNKQLKAWRLRSQVTPLLSCFNWKLLWSSLI